MDRKGHMSRDEKNNTKGSRLTVDKVQMGRLVRPPSLREVGDDPIDVL
jgi:hypothetical protein